MADPGLVELPGPYGGHPGSVFTVAYSPDGTLVASGGWDGTVRLWDPGSGDETAVLAGHAGPVRSVAFAPAGTLLASGGRDGTVRLWDPVSRTSAGLLRGHADAVLAVAFAPDGTLLATASADRTVRLWNPLDGAQQAELPDDARAVAFSPDGRVLATAGRDGKIRLWNLSDRTPVTLAGHTAQVVSVAFAPDGALLASAAGDGTIRLWDPRDGAQRAEVRDDARAVAFSPDGRTLASAGHDGGILVRDLTRIPEPALVQLPYGRLDRAANSHGLAFAPDGARLASADDAGDVRLYDLSGQAAPRSLAGHTCEILSVARTPDGSLLATGDVDGAIRIWRTADGSLLRRLGVDREWVRALAFSADGTLLAAAIGGRIRVWDAAKDFTLVLAASSGGRPVTAVAFAGPSAPGQPVLVSAGSDDRLVIWTAHDGSLVAASAVDGASVSAASVSAAAGTTVVGAGRDGVLRRWTLDDGLSGPGPSDAGLSDEGVFSTGPAGRVRCVALRPDGQVVAAGADGTVLLWHVATPARPTILNGHDGTVRALAFSADGALLASAGDDGAVRLWDAGDGSAVRILPDRARVIRSVTFMPDDVTLVSVGDDGRINFWNTRTGTMAGRPARAPAPPPAPGIRSDEPSREDRLGVGTDVRMLATLIAAASTEPPLAVALLGEWGAGKSSVLLQVRDEVDRICAVAGSDPGDGEFVRNVCHVRFNAWHYSDDQVWTGLIDHLFRKLAAAASGPATGSASGPAGEGEGGQGPLGPGEIAAERDRLRQEVAAQEARCAQLTDREDRESRGLAARNWKARSWKARNWKELGRQTWRDKPFLLRGLFAVGVLVLSVFQPVFGLLASLGRAWDLAGPVQQAAAAAAGSPADEARQARDRLAALKDQLAQVDAAARLARLLNQHEDADPYGARRGLTGQVHRDLEQLATDLDKLRRERRAAGDLAPPPLERIILYIDDLDRCAPSRVAEVLAAIHLMLALPLFVVIVAVDPRWLLEALRRHYRDLLAREPGGHGGPGAPGGPGSDAGDQPASPLDYLDKIFQIPFAVRSLDPENATGYLASLLGQANPEVSGPAPEPPAAPELAPTTTKPSETSTTPETSATNALPTATPPTRTPPTRTPPTSTLPAAERPTPAGPEGGPRPGPRPGSLVLRAPESDFMIRLGPLLNTPRAAKKLVNLYRLVRIGIPEEDLPTFIGLGGYQVVQILLAILVGSPDEAPAIFTAIRDADAAPAPPSTPNTPNTPDHDIVAVLSGTGTAAGRRAAEFIDAVRAEAPGTQAQEAVTGIRAYQRWCPVLARYSFRTRSLA